MSPKYQIVTATKKIRKLYRRIRGVSGGTGASKTISILDWLITYAYKWEGKIISVVSETFPHLKRGAIRDFLNLMESNYDFREAWWNKTDYIYTFPTGSKIEFFSSDQPGKVRGPRRDILFINETNNVSYEIYTQLEIRTNDIIWLDWNPVQEFWFYTEIQQKQDVDFIILTYKDNEALHPSIVRSIESRRGNVNWWKVYGLGELGEVEAKIYTGWGLVDDVPSEARLERYGLDFGYSNDPTAAVAIFYLNGALYFDQLIYHLGLSNHQIAVYFKKMPRATIIADSAEPKSIAEIRSYRLPIIGAQKGKDSVNYGIQYLQAQKIYVTKRSVDLIREYRNYFWQTDKNGHILNIPIDSFNNALDAARYGVTGRGKIGVKIQAGPVKMIGPDRTSPKWVETSKGLVTPDFWGRFREEATRRKSTAAVEFKR